MSTIEDVIDQVIQGKVQAGFIPCTDKANQESIRVMTFNAKNRLPEIFKSKLAISKFSYGEELYVKVYEKPTKGFMVMNENGELVPGEKIWTLSKDKALQRQIKLMREDGIDEEEIQKVIEQANGEEEEEKKVESLEPNPELRGIDSKNEGVLTEKEEMKRMMKEEKRKEKGEND